VKNKKKKKDDIIFLKAEVPFQDDGFNSCMHCLLQLTFEI